MVSGQKVPGPLSRVFEMVLELSLPQKTKAIPWKVNPNPQAARSGPQLYAVSPLLDPYRKDLLGLDQTRQVIASLLLDICLIFTIGESDRMFNRTVAEELNLRFSDRPWAEARKGQQIDGLWLAKQLRPLPLLPGRRGLGRGGLVIRASLPLFTTPLPLLTCNLRV